MAERDRTGEEDKINEIQKTLQNRTFDLQRSFMILVGVGLFFFFSAAFTVLFVNARV